MKFLLLLHVEIKPEVWERLSHAQKVPSGELTFCHGKSPSFMGKSTISMAIFNCYVSSPEGNAWDHNRSATRYAYLGTISAAPEIGLSW